jgi:hypothetical protein
MAVSARFYVQQITHRASGGGVKPEGGEVVLAPSYANGKNADWSKYTPAGSITLQVSGPAFGWFKEHLSADVAITFDDVPSEE